MIALIWAEDQNGLIGANGQLPWHLSADLKRFKRLTLNHPVVMGRKTFASFKRPLPHRQNIVLSRQADLALPASVVQWTDLTALTAYQTAHPDETIFVIGGAAVFEAVLPLADQLYRTRINASYDGDTWMPEIDYNDWQLSDQTPGQSETDPVVTFSFDDFTRRKIDKKS
ncbi:dihydrofolate reductase [Lactiplantibacillus mudanjiangensis]|uniref:Dihydrofolate reductase n=1 Tax=Lactiplantibacillus mudanjiangensis TaxID=1296538 RepID=A0A660EB56_9LACO|nr:dihydrofolate reductase [Lactiplantibacillus mudanjiangensis]VDG20494.1 dihydrofolate reductase [Lactobacillus sp.] [Lactiplantibacillus mudanjiangensis]VDG24280.1 dihydrofolate reductase [Lactobacillus sp.] [Lactiplantibacillus mudanjiangensis]VDG30457.1 dihydrofolate reductase [Lactobacillus sp.] [Lactiplantibacillus mudanjiangensis]VDG30768.1 dihydrofolate reductase [Lactobacillus sp.] [Lactiplantibacillus mudanjiangensis]